MSPELRAALEDAYQAFAEMPAPTHLDASPLRDAAEILATLTGRPLRELTNEEIGPYSGWAMTTVGSAQDYCHFLPRILELSVSDPAWIGSEPPVIASRLERADWRRWPESQQQAVTAVFHAAFYFAIRSDPGTPRPARRTGSAASPGWIFRSQGFLPDGDSRRRLNPLCSWHG